MPLYEPLSDEEVILASVLKQALRGTFTSNLSEEKDASRKKKISSANGWVKPASHGVA